jgi:hypothetical protein
VRRGLRLASLVRCRGQLARQLRRRGHLGRGVGRHFVVRPNHGREASRRNSLRAYIVRQVTCLDDTDCYAVGVGEATKIYAATLVTTNVGQSWTLDAAPSGEDYLDEVSCKSATTCVAVADGAYPVMSTTE